MLVFVMKMIIVKKIETSVLGQVLKRVLVTYFYILFPSFLVNRTLNNVPCPKIFFSFPCHLVQS